MKRRQQGQTRAGHFRQQPRERVITHLLIVEHAHQVTVHLPCVECFLIVHVALCKQDVDSLQIIDVFVLLVSLADLCSDSSRWDVGCIECDYLWGGSVCW